MSGGSPRPRERVTSPKLLWPCATTEATTSRRQLFQACLIPAPQSTPRDDLPNSEVSPRDTQCAEDRRLAEFHWIPNWYPGVLLARSVARFHNRDMESNLRIVRTMNHPPEDPLQLRRPDVPGVATSSRWSG